MDNFKNDYPVIPMMEITDEAREIAVTWFEADVKGMDWIGDKHKLASDIMNYARRHRSEPIQRLIDQAKIFVMFNDVNGRDGLNDSAAILLNHLREICKEL